MGSHHLEHSHIHILGHGTYIPCLGHVPSAENGVDTAENAEICTEGLPRTDIRICPSIGILITWSIIEHYPGHPRIVHRIPSVQVLCRRLLKLYPSVKTIVEENPVPGLHSPPHRRTQRIGEIRMNTESHTVPEPLYHRLLLEGDPGHRHLGGRDIEIPDPPVIAHRLHLLLRKKRKAGPHSPGRGILRGARQRYGSIFQLRPDNQLPRKMLHLHHTGTLLHLHPETENGGIRLETEIHVIVQPVPHIEAYLAVLTGNHMECPRLHIFGTLRVHGLQVAPDTRTVRQLIAHSLLQDQIIPVLHKAENHRTETVTRISELCFRSRSEISVEHSDKKAEVPADHVVRDTPGLYVIRRIQATPESGMDR